MKMLFLLSLLSINISASAQKFVVTPSGLKNAEDTTKNYVVINVKDKNAKDLYSTALNYLNRNCFSPQDAIKGKIEGEYLRFVTTIQDFCLINNKFFDVDYSTELSFKDAKVKFEIVTILIYSESGRCQLLFNGGRFDIYALFKSTKLYLPDTKMEIENYFNTQIISLKSYLESKNVNGNW